MRWLYGFWLLVSSTAYSAWYHESRAIMGTEVSIEFWHESEVIAQQAIAAAMAEFDRIDQQYSPYKPNSALALLNQHGYQKSVAISQEFSYLLQRAMHYSVLSDGAFDISFASVGYRYDYRSAKKPSDEWISSTKAAINYRQIALNIDKNTVEYRHPNTRIDLGGIAKGYAIDRVAQKLVALGIQHAAIAAGGDTRFVGDKRGRPWMVGIQHPRQEDSLAVVLPMQDFAMSTSGDYERFYIDPTTGMRVHHIINPQSGKPAHAIGSVTVIGPQGIDTDALSTTLFVLGVTRGMALLEQQPAFDGIIVEANGEIHYSSGLMPPAPESGN